MAKKFPAEAIKNVKLTFAGNVLKTTKPDGETEATFVLHPEMDPKGIDLDMEGNLGLGIYKLDGDSLSILHGEIEEPRPKEFGAVKDGALTLLVLRNRASSILLRFCVRRSQRHFFAIAAERQGLPTFNVGTTGNAARCLISVILPFAIVPRSHRPMPTC